MATHDDVPAVACRGLGLSFDGTPAVRDLDLDVPRGRVTALLGPSGCGKTTTLRLIAGFERPQTGTIDLDGHCVATPQRSEPPERRRVGMVFQDYALFPHLSVGANIAYGIRRMAREARHQRVREVLELVGLTGFGRRQPAELSGGQQQRVALARALAPRPAVVLLDEPFSNLDATLRETVRADVRAILRSAGTTALFVTHDQEEALSLADRVAVMTDGNIRQVADPQTLYTEPHDLFVATFVGDADVIRGQRAGERLVATALGSLATVDPVTDHDLRVVIRPELLRLEHDSSGQAEVESVAFFGHDQLVHVRLPDGDRIRSRLGPSERFEIGDRVRVGVAGRVAAFPAGDTGSAPPRPTAVPAAAR